MDGLRVLTVQNFGDTEAENGRVTLAPMAIKMVASFDDTKQGRSLKRLHVLFLEGDNVELYVSEMDALTIEQAIGTYGFEMV